MDNHYFIKNVLASRMIAMAIKILSGRFRPTTELLVATIEESANSAASEILDRLNLDKED